MYLGAVSGTPASALKLRPTTLLDDERSAESCIKGLWERSDGEWRGGLGGRKNETERGDGASLSVTVTGVCDRHGIFRFAFAVQCSIHPVVQSDRLLLSHTAYCPISPSISFKYPAVLGSTAKYHPRDLFAYIPVSGQPLFTFNPSFFLSNLFKCPLLQDRTRTPGSLVLSLPVLGE